MRTAGPIASTRNPQHEAWPGPCYLPLPMRLLAILLLTGACTTDLGTQPAPQGNLIDEYIEALPYLPVDPPQVLQGSASAAERDGDYSCTTQNLKETRNYDEIVAYAANSDSLYPG